MENCLKQINILLLQPLCSLRNFDKQIVGGGGGGGGGGAGDGDRENLNSNNSEISLCLLTKTEIREKRDCSEKVNGQTLRISSPFPLTLTLPGFPSFFVSRQTNAKCFPSFSINPPGS